MKPRLQVSRFFLSSLLLVLFLHRLDEGSVLEIPDCLVSASDDLFPLLQSGYDLEVLLAGDAGLDRLLEIADDELTASPKRASLRG